MNWSKLLTVRCWTPIETLEIKSVLVAGNLFRVSDNCYLTAVGHNAQLKTSRSPLVTIAIWAESEGAARRACLGEIEADVARTGLSIPEQILLPGKPATYGEIVATLYNARNGTFIESAVYRIASDGAFIHRVLHVGRREFCFRSLKEHKDEIPYAILRRLEK